MTHSAAAHIRRALPACCAWFCSRKIHGQGHDQVILSLQIDADLRSVFNWNVKQLFVYVTAEYETEANVRAYACIVTTIGPCRPCVCRYATASRPL